MENSRSKILLRASLIAVAGNALLAALKIIFGLTAGSMALIADGIDSGTDIITSLITFFASIIVSRPPDCEHPYGHSRAETMATTLLSFIIFFAGAQLLINSVKGLLSQSVSQLPGYEALAAALVSIAGKLLLSLYLHRVGAKTSSSMISANAKNMRNDIVISLGVFTGLIITEITRVPQIDQAIALLVSIWIIKTAVGIFMEMNTELMDGSADISIYNKIFDAVSKIKEARRPHRVRARKLASMLIIDIDIEVDPELSVREAHKIARRVEESIKSSLSNVYDVMVHMEPLGNVENREKFGISENDSAPEIKD